MAEHYFSGTKTSVATSSCISTVGGENLSWKRLNHCCFFLGAHKRSPRTRLVSPKFVVLLFPFIFQEGMENESLKLQVSIARNLPIARWSKIPRWKCLHCHSSTNSFEINSFSASCKLFN